MAQAGTQGSDIGVEKEPWTPGQPRDHQQDHHSTAGQGWSLGNHTRGEGGTWGQVSVVTWDDSQPARLPGLAYIIGDFTDIFAGVFLRDVGEGEDLHVRAVNARTLQPIHKHTHKFKRTGREKHTIKQHGGSRGSRRPGITQQGRSMD